jgi:hypothetical protein
MKSAKKVLFIRSQEPDSYPDKGKRILGDYATKYEKSEKQYLQEFSKFIKNNYNFEFKILFMSEEGEFVEEGDNIVGISSPGCKYTGTNVIGQSRKHFDSHKEFLEKNL